MNFEEKIKQILEEIVEGKGAYSRDHLTHAKNTINDMKNLAAKGLKLLQDHEQKMEELAELLKAHPHHEANTYFDEYTDWIEKLEKKFRELKEK